MSKKIVISSVLILLVVGVLYVSSVYACGIKSSYSYNAWSAKTTTNCDSSATYNNYLYAETIAWSVSTDGQESFHQGPKTKKYNAKTASSSVSVPYGRGTWFECHYEGNCNRCGEVLGYAKKMFAF